MLKFIALLLFPVFSFSQSKLSKTSLLDGKAEILVPGGLSKMTDEMWALKYHTAPRPILVLSDENGEVNLMADMTKQPATESQLAAYKDFRVANLKKTRTDVTIQEEGLKTTNGKKVGFIKFSSQATDQKIFNFYFFSIVDGKILFFTFNCIESLKATWEKTADEILLSLKTKS